MFCPKCAKEVSDQAQTCPGCGHPFSQSYQGSLNLQGASESKLVVLLLCLLLPGVHRMYVGKILSGILFVVTGGGLLVWWVIDLISIVRGTFEDKDGNKVNK